HHLTAVLRAALRSRVIGKLVQRSPPLVAAEKHGLLEVLGEAARDGQPIKGDPPVMPLTAEPQIAPAADERAAAAALDAVDGIELGKREPGERIVLVNRSEEHTSELQSLRHLVCRL